MGSNVIDIAGLY